MEASTRRRPFGAGSARGLTSSRRGSLVLAALVALAAAVLIFLFIDDQRTGGGIVGGGAERVLVAKALIPKGSSGDVIAAQRLTVATTLDADDVRDGAVTDPGALAGQVAAKDIYPGQQLTAASFKENSDGVTARLAGDQRAVSVPVDAAHGMIGTVETGDRVDVFVAVGTSGFTSGSEPAVRALLQNVLVLRAPDEDESDEKVTNIVLRADSAEAAKLAFAAENGRIWVALRPPVGARSTSPSVVTLDTLLAGTSAVPEGAE